MDSQAVAGLIGVVVGAALSWLVSSSLERKRERKRLSGVIGLLAAELRDNGKRIRQGLPNQHTEQGWGDILTYGDWHANKATFSELMRDEALWKRVVKEYGAIYSATSGPRDPPPADELDALARDLEAVRQQLQRRRFGSARS